VVGINFSFGPAGYNKEAFSLNHFDLFIDLGWFLLSPSDVWALDLCYHLVGKFGIAILLVTVLGEAVVFPRAPTSPTPSDGQDEKSVLAATGRA